MKIHKRIFKRLLGFGWISAKKKKPEKSGQYLILCHYGKQGDVKCVADYDADSGNFDIERYGAKITHWMEIPEVEG